MIANLKLIIATFLMAITSAIVGVEIRHMRVPSVLQNGSKPFVILDCDYDISSEQEGRGLDVKWFFGNNHQPFYQWLPGRRPQTRGERFRGRIDLHYEVEGSNKFSKHRALKILRPTTELSGTYRCKVSSFLDEDFRQKTMIIYSPPRDGDVTLIYTRPDENHINLTCSARGVFPKPVVTLSWGRRYHERGETTTLTVEKDGLFDVSVNKMLDVEQLQPETVFQCLLRIPGTQFSVREETMYFPGKVQSVLSSSATKTSSPIWSPVTNKLYNKIFGKRRKNEENYRILSVVSQLLSTICINCFLFISFNVVLQTYTNNCHSYSYNPLKISSYFRR